MRLMLLSLMLFTILFAHGDEPEEHEEHAGVWERLNLPDPMDIVYIASLVSGLAVVIALMAIHGLSNQGKKIIFFIIAVPVVVATLYLAATTVYLNMVSETGGPVHWHADYEMWACGQQYELVDPKNFDNKIGSPVFHEHNDNRIHAEGVLFQKRDARLGRFFTEVGGKLTRSEFILPTEDGLKTWKNGEICNGKPAKLQVFVYKIVNANPSQKTGFLYKQTKLDDFSDYVLSEYANVPPGDCIIIEFDQEKVKTDKSCSTYELAIEKGEMREADGS
ncbi:hypothetical protein J4450_01415 [Candidatus Micrarchaeota archaeon]|nr:hypothetical protein [Candidatus Micrarchaeota archaeon]